jgi:hypothetical protein
LGPLSKKNVLDQFRERTILFRLPKKGEERRFRKMENGFDANRDDLKEVSDNHNAFLLDDFQESELLEEISMACLSGIAVGYGY